MFPSQQLISYVFANPDDEYRGGDLLTLNLRQYLWKSLHQQYHTVYFLESSDDFSFTVRTFQERDATRPGVPMFWQSYEEVFGRWLHKQLCLKREKAAAFVCPMDVFCRVFSRESWTSTLEKIATDPDRTGIFVLTASPYAEDSRKYLLESPVFELLREYAVTANRDKSQNVYSAIRREKPGNCRFLNAFTPGRVDDLLLHICARYPERTLSIRQRPALAEDLAASLQNGKGIPWQLESLRPAMYQTYRWLYEQLCSQTVWNYLTEPNRTYLSYRESPELPILHSPSCYEGRSITLRIPAWARNQMDSNGKSPRGLLREIRQLVATPANCPENEEIADAAFEFMKQLDKLDEGDIDTCVLLLDALKFCTRWIHIHSEDSHYEEVFRILNGLKVCTVNSAACFRGNRELSGRESDPTASGQERLALDSSRRKLNEKMKTLHNYVSLLKANILTMETSDYTDNQVLIDVLTKEMQNTDTDEYALTGSQRFGHVPYTPIY